MFECAVPGCDQEGSYFVGYEAMISICEEPEAFFLVCNEHSRYQQQDDRARPLQVPLAANGR